MFNKFHPNFCFSPEVAENRGFSVMASSSICGFSVTSPVSDAQNSPAAAPCSPWRNLDQARMQRAGPLSLRPKSTWGGEPARDLSQILIRFKRG